MNNHSRWTSRKFIVAAVAMVFTIVATAGFDMPVEETALVDGVLMFYVLVEGIIDMIKK